MANRFTIILLLQFAFCGLFTFPGYVSSLTATGSRNLKSHRAVPISGDELENIEEVEENNEEKELEFLSEDETKHPCQRTCEEGKPMTCRYKFTIEYFSTMSKACYNCPYNITHCSFKECIPGDGVKRTILVINRQLPGPAIDVCYGDTIEVDVKNRMFDISTTIHWHGILQKETPFMDGVPFVSQCMISPQANFLYRFYADNPGTHLWHSHSALQRGDGMFGPLIIRVPPSQDPHAHLYDFDLPEHVVNIIDWEHMLSVNKFVSHYHSFGDNKPPSILVNGKGRFEEFRDGDNIIYTPAEKFTVKPGFRYRFRIINAGFLNCPIEISVDSHNLTIIASDGGNLEPIEAETLTTVAGERFDIVLEAKQEIKNYWMRFKGTLDCKVKKAFQVAILHYEGADEDTDPEADATYDTSVRSGLKVNAVNTAVGVENSLLMSEIPSLGEDEDDPVLKPEPDVKIYVPYDFYPVSNIHFQAPPYDSFYRTLRNQRIYTPQINHISMQFPSFPVMANLERASSLEVCNGTSISMECRFEFCECPHVLQVPLNAVVEFILIDEGVPYEANHPFHLHGYTFRLLGMDRLGSSTTEEEVRRLDQEGLLKRNLKNPPIKDTVTVPDGGYSILRFHATNPGYWILHCHLDFHVEMGMALLFKVGDHATYKSPPEGLPMCGDAFEPIPVNQTVYARFYPTKSASEKGRLDKFGKYTYVSSSTSLSFCHVLLMICLSAFGHLK